MDIEKRTSKILHVGCTVAFYFVSVLLALMVLMLVLDERLILYGIIFYSLVIIFLIYSGTIIALRRKESFREKTIGEFPQEILLVMANLIILYLFVLTPNVLLLVLGWILPILAMLLFLSPIPFMILILLALHFRVFKNPKAAYYLYWASGLITLPIGVLSIIAARMLKKNVH